MIPLAIDVATIGAYAAATVVVIGAVTTSIISILTFFAQRNAAAQQAADKADSDRRRNATDAAVAHNTAITVETKADLGKVKETAENSLAINSATHELVSALKNSPLPPSP